MLLLFLLLFDLWSLPSPILPPLIHRMLICRRRICNRAKKTKSTGPSVHGSRVTGFVLSDYAVVVVVVTVKWGEYDVEELCVDHLNLSERGNKRYIYIFQREDKQICLVHSVYIKQTVKQTIVSSGVCIVEPIKTDSPRKERRRTDDIVP